VLTDCHEGFDNRRKLIVTRPSERDLKLMLSDQRLNRIAQATQELIKAWKEGVSTEVDAGSTIDDLLRIGAAARWRLALIHRTHANVLRTSEPPRSRSAVSRYYYSMYQAMRACMFLFYQGDDYQDHAKLYLNIPNDFPSASHWQGKLKDARLARNRADYDPYPSGEKTWQTIAAILKTDADLLLKEARQYLKNRGCKV
jgi:uncharacterized protein (UPF0332 family)